MDANLIDPKATYVLSGETLKKILTGNAIKGSAGQISIRKQPDGTHHVGFDSVTLVTLIQNGAEVDVLIPMQNAVA